MRDAYRLRTEPSFLLLFFKKVTSFFDFSLLILCVFAGVVAPLAAGFAYVEFRRIDGFR